MSKDQQAAASEPAVTGDGAPEASGGRTSQRRVVIVDDHAMFRSGVKHDIGPYVTIVGEGEDVPTAVEVIVRTLPDVVLLDVHLPGGGGVEIRARSEQRAALVHEDGQDLCGARRRDELDLHSRLPPGDTPRPL